METRKKIKYALLAVKIVISVALLTLIFKKAGMQNIATYLRAMDLRYFLFSSLLYILTIFIGGLRWGLLLDEKYPLGKLFSLYMIGAFFNNFLPGAVGGDAVKTYYLYKDLRKTGSSFGSVFLDRYIGLFALLSIGLVSGFFAFDELKSVHMQWVIPAIFAAYITGSVLVFGLKIGSRFSILADFYLYFHTYLKKPSLLVKSFFLSLFIQALCIGMISIISLGIGQRLSFTALFVFVPIIVTITTLPISISGFGVREGAFALFFGMTGVSADVSTSISFLWFLSIAFASLIGFVEYLRFKHDHSVEV